MNEQPGAAGQGHTVSSETSKVQRMPSKDQHSPKLSPIASGVGRVHFFPSKECLVAVIPRFGRKHQERDT